MKLTSWQYNGVAPWFDIMTWCYENIPGGYYTNIGDTIFFVNEKDFTMFTLRWA